MKVAIIGSGGREQAIARSLGQFDHNVALILPQQAIGTTADLFVFGSEVPLVQGLANRLRGQGKTVFGPSADGAQLEGSKAYMKEFCSEFGIPTAPYKVFDRFDMREVERYLRRTPGPWVIKTSYLAGGKGVLVTSDIDEAIADSRAKLTKGEIVIEECLEGYEMSVFVVTDGRNCQVLPVAQDYKRLLDGDLGPNTGGMGAYCPVRIEPSLQQAITETIGEPIMKGLATTGIQYRGVLFLGLMITKDGPQLLEINVRFGDPETQVILPLLETDLADLLFGAARGALAKPLRFTSKVAVTVVLAAEGYPHDPQSGDQIYGIESAAKLEGVHILEAGVEYRDGKPYTAGGRVLNVVAVASNFDRARTQAYRAAKMVRFRGMQYRKDIAENI